MYNVVLMVIDCLRADHVSSYGYPRQTTPNIDALSRKGLIFEHVLFPWDGVLLSSVGSG